MDGTTTIEELVEKRNGDKRLFTAGPAALLPENITGLRPCFGRGDGDYDAVEQRVLVALKKLSGHANLARLQGSASLALEIMAMNFLYGRVLVIDSGYYAKRLAWLAESAQRRTSQITDIRVVDWRELDQIEGRYDWIFSCYTETSCALKLSVEQLRQTADAVSAKLMLDATASIGLEQHHELADVIAYSSCKGLFGLAGAAFVAYHETPTVQVDSFYLDLANHVGKKMTGPYHAIASLDDVLAKHGDFRAAVVENKHIFTRQLTGYLTQAAEHQPLLCTHVNCTITSHDDRAILYKPRSDQGGSVVCHLGEIYRGCDAKGEILSSLEVAE